MHTNTCAHTEEYGVEVKIEHVWKWKQLWGERWVNESLLAFCDIYVGKIMKYV